MGQSSTSPAPPVPQLTAQGPLSILRTETVLSRFPVHLLTKRGRVTVHLQRTNAHGVLELRWTVSYNEHYGPPRQLAYKLDTIVIQQRLDALPRPLPRVLKVGSLRQICADLEVDGSGRQQAELKRAFHQNASAYIVAYLRYRGRDGIERTLNTGFTRYSVVLTGETLPDGATADAVYLLLSDPYRDVLNHAPVRPLDYAYLKVLPPTAQRFYELLSYKMFAAVKYRHPSATLRYADYCMLSTQHRLTVGEQVQKQMYKVHRPHLRSGYLGKVRYEATVDTDGRPDWLLHYTPGPKAHAEHTAFMRQPGADAAALVAPAEADQEDLAATVTRALPRVTPPPRHEVTSVALTAPPEAQQDTLASARTTALSRTCRVGALSEATMAPGAPSQDVLLPQADALVRQFYQRFHGRAPITPGPKELAHATALLATHGAAKAQFLLVYARQAARATAYMPQTFMGIEHYLHRALAAYDAQTARATQAATQRAAADERTQREQYQAWEQHQLAQRRAALPPQALAALEAEAHARLVAAGTPAVALPLAVRVAVDQVLAAQAGLPSFEDWQHTQEAG